ncbi:MAG: Xaa-Pro peptidase family protein [Actinomycetota bacterium]
MDHALRRERLSARLADLGVDALLVTYLPNVRYLTGFTGSSGQLLVTADAAVFFSDGRYTEQSAREAPDLERVIHRGDFTATLLDRCRHLGLSRLGFEAGAVTYRFWDELRSGSNGLDLVPAETEVERLRWVKDEEELALIRRAQETADVAFEQVVLGGLREGTTERELAFDIELAMRRAGADELAFQVIAAFGASAAEPHHSPTQRPLRPGDVVKLDFGALVDGYHSDMTRTVAFGGLPARLQEGRDVVARAQQAGIDAVRAGAGAREVDRAARAVVEEAGLGEWFPHGLGHGVGLEIHEGPRLRWDSDDLLAAGAVVTIEPGVYIPSVGGVRIEDMVEVTDEGCREIGRSSKELIVL